MEPIKRLNWLILFIAVAMISCDTKYAKVMESKFKTILGDDVKNWDFFSFPTSNYGIGTLYRDIDGDGGLGKDEASPICLMWGCLDIGVPPYPEPGSSSDVWLTYAGIGEFGETGSISLTEREETSLNIDFILPNFFNVVGIDATSLNERVVTTSLVINQAYRRSLNEGQWIERMRSVHPIGSPIRNNFENGDLFITREDIVFNGFTSTISVDSEMSGDLDTALDGVSSKIFSDGSKLSFTIKRGAEGKFIVESAVPIVVARKVAIQSMGGGLDEEFRVPRKRFPVPK